MDRQISWNDLSNSPMFTSEANISCIDLTSDDTLDMNTWTSRPTFNRNALGEHGWASALTNSDSGLRIEESHLRSNNMHTMVNSNYSLINSQANDNIVHNSSSSHSGSSSRGMDATGSSFNGCILSRKRKEIDGSYTSGSSSSVYLGESSSMHHSLSTHQNANTALRIGPSNLDTSEYHNYSVNGSRERSNRNCRVRINPPNQWDPINNHLSPNQEINNQSDPINNHLSPNQEINNQFGSLNLSNLSSTTLAQNMHPSSQNIHPLSMNIASSSRTINSSTLLNNTLVMHRNTDTRCHFISPADVNHSNSTTRGGTMTLPNPFSYPRVSQQVGSQLLISSSYSGSSQNISVPQSSGSLNTNSHESSRQRAANLTSSIQESYVRPGSGIMPSELSARSHRRRILAEHFQNELARRGELISLEDLLILNRVIVRGRSVESHDRHRDMRLDVDNMSYEELLALEEEIGDVNTGLNEEKIMKCLKQRKYISLFEEIPSDVEPCCICQELYGEEEDVGRLDCGHDFHTVCIKEWLMRKNLCPICKTTGLA